MQNTEQFSSSQNDPRLKKKKKGIWGASSHSKRPQCIMGGQASCRLASQFIEEFHQAVHGLRSVICSKCVLGGEYLSLWVFNYLNELEDGHGIRAAETTSTFYMKPEQMDPSRLKSVSLTWWIKLSCISPWKPAALPQRGFYLSLPHPELSIPSPVLWRPQAVNSVSRHPEPTLSTQALGKRTVMPGHGSDSLPRDTSVFQTVTFSGLKMCPPVTRSSLVAGDRRNESRGWKIPTKCSTLVSSAMMATFLADGRRVSR